MFSALVFFTFGFALHNCAVCPYMDSIFLAATLEGQFILLWTRAAYHFCFGWVASQSLLSCIYSCFWDG